MKLTKGPVALVVLTLAAEMDVTVPGTVTLRRYYGCNSAADCYTR